MVDIQEPEEQKAIVPKDPPILDPSPKSKIKIPCERPGSDFGEKSNEKSLNYALQIREEALDLIDCSTMDETKSPSNTGSRLIQLADFESVKDLGAGGFGTVSLVRFKDPDLAKHVAMPLELALKKVYMGQNVSIMQKKQAMKEALFLQQLPSKHFIKPYHSFFEKNAYGSLYFCILMEYARKGDVLNYFIKKAKIEKKQIQESQIWTICKSVGQGLAILHKKNIVHKDIKPQNLLVMEDETIKIGDMGISVSVAHSENKSMSISKVGTPLYQAPEVLKRQPYSFKVDVWALGCLLYYMACLKPPFVVAPQVVPQEKHGGVGGVQGAGQGVNNPADKNNRKPSPFVQRDQSPFRGGLGKHTLSRKQLLEEMIINEQQQVIPQHFYSSTLQGVISRLLDKVPQNRPTAQELLLLIPSDLAINDLSARQSPNMGIQRHGFGTKSSADFRPLSNLMKNVNSSKIEDRRLSALRKQKVSKLTDQLKQLNEDTEASQQSPREINQKSLNQQRITPVELLKRKEEKDKRAQLELEKKKSNEMPPQSNNPNESDLANNDKKPLEISQNSQNNHNNVIVQENSYKKEQKLNQYLKEAILIAKKKSQKAAQKPQTVFIKSSKNDSTQNLHLMNKSRLQFNNTPIQIDETSKNEESIERQNSKNVQKLPSKSNFFSFTTRLSPTNQSILEQRDFNATANQAQKVYTENMSPRNQQINVQSQESFKPLMPAQQKQQHQIPQRSVLSSLKQMQQIDQDSQNQEIIHENSNKSKDVHKLSKFHSRNYSQVTPSRLEILKGNSSLVGKVEAITSQVQSRNSVKEMRTTNLQLKIGNQIESNAEILDEKVLAATHVNTWKNRALMTSKRADLVSDVQIPENDVDLQRETHLSFLKAQDNQSVGKNKMQVPNQIIETPTGVGRNGILKKQSHTDKIPREKAQIGAKGIYKNSKNNVQLKAEGGTYDWELYEITGDSFQKSQKRKNSIKSQLNQQPLKAEEKQQHITTTLPKLGQIETQQIPTTIRHKSIDRKRQENFPDKAHTMKNGSRGARRLEQMCEILGKQKTGSTNIYDQEMISQDGGGSRKQKRITGQEKASILMASLESERLKELAEVSEKTALLQGQSLMQGKGKAKLKVQSPVVEANTQTFPVKKKKSVSHVTSLNQVLVSEKGKQSTTKTKNSLNQIQTLHKLNILLNSTHANEINTPLATAGDVMYRKAIPMKVDQTAQQLIAQVREFPQTQQSYLLQEQSLVSQKKNRQQNLNTQQMVQKRREGNLQLKSGQTSVTDKLLDIRKQSESQPAENNQDGSMVDGSRGDIANERYVGEETTKNQYYDLASLKSQDEFRDKQILEAQQLTSPTDQIRTTSLALNQKLSVVNSPPKNSRSLSKPVRQVQKIILQGKKHSETLRSRKVGNHSLQQDTQHLLDQAVCRETILNSQDNTMKVGSEIRELNYSGGAGPKTFQASFYNVPSKQKSQTQPTKVPNFQKNPKQLIQRFQKNTVVQSRNADFSPLGALANVPSNLKEQPPSSAVGIGGDYQIQSRLQNRHDEKRSGLLKNASNSSFNLGSHSFLPKVIKLQNPVDFVKNKYTIRDLSSKRP